MSYTILPDPQIVNMMIDVAKLSSMQIIIEMNLIKSDISLREANRKYGPAIVKRWHEEGLIKYLQDGPNMRIRIDRVQIEAVAKASNRGNYLSI
jgi:hypothetical protein